jgi:hypothetical protein
MQASPGSTPSTEHPPEPPTHSGATTSGHFRSDTGLNFRIAETLDDVIAAWQLVYRSYRRANLIDGNPHGLHTFPEAISPNTAVALGRLGPVISSTISAYLDREQGLPLDSVYARELDTLRNQGRTLMEVGLFADRRQHLDRTIGALLELMRHACFFGVSYGATDAVIGVHPHHAKFYARLLGFQLIGEQKSYDAVSGNPVVLLRLDWYRVAAEPQRPRGIDYLLTTPLTTEAYQTRFDFAADAVQQSVLAHFVKRPHRAVA